MTESTTDGNTNPVIPKDFSNDMNIDQDWNKDFYPNNTRSNYSYRCPRCGGEFNHWDKGNLNFKSKRYDYFYYCPFCGLERGEYNPRGGMIWLEEE